MARSLALAALLAVCAVAPALDAVAEFRRAWAAASDDSSRIAAVEALSAAGGDAAAGVLVQLVAHPDLARTVTGTVADCIARLADDAAVARVCEEARSHRDLETRTRLTAALGRSAHEARVAALLGLAADPELPVRSAAVGGLSRVQRPEVVDALLARLEEESGRMAGEVRRALRAITGQRLRELEEWATWWAARREGFVFPPLSGEADAVERVRLGDPETTRAAGDDGGTVYEVESDRVVFVVDVSHSMTVRALEGEGGITRLDFVKRELTGAIDRQLGAEARFDIIVFADEVQAWKGKLVRATPSARAEARHFVRGLRTAGETNSMGALDAAFAVRGADTICFLSDGFPTAGRLTGTEEILDEVVRMNRGRGIAIHTVAFLAGDGTPLGVVEAKDVSRAFMARLAEAAGGRARVVE
ncbi:MAG: HEAT repeat domain-containing protein [Planctomycetes bacterium]|nr:HEAT repeat domain-containing protein [Planctomycetota bacterium]